MASQTSPRTSARTRAQTISRHPHLIMQTPSTAQIRTAIEVLKKFGEHINHNADNLVIELPDTRMGVTWQRGPKCERSNKPPALSPSPRNWKIGATNWCNRGGNVFLIMFKTGQALLLPGGRSSSPRNGRETGAEQPRNVTGSWPQTRHFHEIEPVQDRTQPRVSHVHEQSVIRVQSTPRVASANSPCPRTGNGLNRP